MGCGLLKFLRVRRFFEGEDFLRRKERKGKNKRVREREERKKRKRVLER